MENGIPWGTIIGGIIIVIALILSPRYFKHLSKLKKEVEEEEKTNKR